MAPKASKRRSPGEGSVWPYQTKAGERWAIGHPSFGTRRNASGWGKTKRTAQQALRDMLTDASRGEALALRWRDLDLDAAMARIRRSVGMVRVAGEGAAVVEGDTKNGRPRLVDLDAPTVAVLRARKRERGALHLSLARDAALVFGDLEGRHRNPEHVSRQFARDVARCCGELGADALPDSRLHDLRHAHATVLLTAGVPVHVVSQRLGHTSAVVTMTVYAHVLPGSQRDAADRFAALIGGARA